MTDIQKLVEDCARIFCCGNTCASLHDSRPCCAADHHVRTCAVIRHTLEFAAREGVPNQSKGGDANAGAARDANKPIPDTSPGVTAGASEAAQAFCDERNAIFNGAALCPSEGADRG